MIFLDTHAVVWLYAGQAKKFTEKGQLYINENDLLVSPMVQFELQYLYEIKRITIASSVLLDDLNKKIGLKLVDISLDELVSYGINEPWTRDPFDRLIVSHARIMNAPLLTKDEKILVNYEQALW